MYYVLRALQLTQDPVYSVRELGDMPADSEKEKIPLISNGQEYDILGHYPTYEQAFNLATVCNQHAGGLVSKDDYANAAAQNACNLGAYIHAFDRVITKLQYEARLFEHGTDWINEHPICRLYAEQIYFLTSSRDWTEAAEYCEKRSGKSST